jgi:MYXO-CTERM domain-containing protein
VTDRKTAFLVLTAVAHVVLTLWVRRDARERDVDPSPWDALTLLTGVGGVLGYRRRR